MVLGLLLALAAALTWWTGRDQRAGPAAAASQAQLLAGRLDLALLRVSTQPAAARAAPQFAVMPFEAPADDEELEGLAESLCDALLELMMRGGAPSASGCNSTRLAAQIGLSPGEVGRLLGVPALLSGNLARDGAAVRLEARMLAAEDGLERWRHAASYSTAQLTDMPRDLLQRIAASAPAGTMTMAAADAGASPSGEAYALFLRALHQQRRGDVEALQAARRLLDEALALAPDYPPAISASVSLNSNLASVGLAQGAAVDKQLRQAAAQLARVAPDSPQAAMVGAAAAAGAQRWNDALRLLDDGVARHPQHVPLLHTQAGILLMMGYLERGGQVALRVARLEPLNASSHERLARAWSLLGDNERMRQSTALARELGWGNRVAGFEAWYALRERDLVGSERAWRAQLEAARLPVDWIAPVLHAHLDPAARPAAVTALQAVPEAARQAMNHMFLAYALAGEWDLTMAALDQTRSAVATMWMSSLWLPELAGLREHPGFVPYLQALGLPALWQENGAPDRCTQASEGLWRCR